MRLASYKNLDSSSIVGFKEIIGLEFSYIHQRHGSHTSSCLYMNVSLCNSLSISVGI
jgi:hypothetical protein